MVSPVQAQSLRVCFYNVENLFDTQHDTLRLDYDFLPEGTYRWTPYKYWRKLHNISRTFAALSEENGWPVLIGLAEVENDTVLRDLTKRSALRAARYEYIVTESPDERGVDVALLYQPRLFTPIVSWSVRVPSVERGLKPTRDILCVKGILTGKDTIYVAVVHLPSRAGNKKSSDRNRLLAVKTLRHTVDSLLRESSEREMVVGERRKGEKMIVMGDFNAEPRDRLFSILQPPLHSLMPQERRELRKAIGTYCYKGLWGFLDHILVSTELQPIAEPRAHVARFPFLLDEKGRPFRTFRGPISQNGFSDHLPIWVDLQY